MKRLLLFVAMLTLMGSAIADGCVQGTGCKEDRQAESLPPSYLFATVGSERYVRAGIGTPMTSSILLEVAYIQYRPSDHASSSSSETTEVKKKKHRALVISTATTNESYSAGPVVGVGPMLVWRHALTGRSSLLLGGGVYIIDRGQQRLPDQSRTDTIGTALVGVNYALSQSVGLRVAAEAMDGARLTVGLSANF